MSLAQTMLTIAHTCSGEQITKAAAIIAQAQIGMTGANLVWLARITMWRGLLEVNGTLVSSAFTRVWAEVKVEKQSGDNIQTDSSFHQHGPQLLAGSYGGDFSEDILELVSQVSVPVCVCVAVDWLAR
jgi:hypothetical protein